jgi:hypothetical protein
VRHRCSVFEMGTREADCLSYAVTSYNEKCMNQKVHAVVQCTAKHPFRPSSSADILPNVHAQFLVNWCGI